MSYLSHPKIYFSGKFRADPSTVNNTPDNFNPNNQFPPDNGFRNPQDANNPPLYGYNNENNVQTFWNPNGTGQFLLDCTINKVSDDLKDLGLEGKSLNSTPDSPLCSAKIVDLDPMQQNVSELWALKLQLGGKDGFPLGNFKVAAYSNIWGQVIGGLGDYAGSGIYQSVLTFEDETVDANPPLKQLLEKIGGAKNQISIAFVVRSYNASSYNYRFWGPTMAVAAGLGVPQDIIAKLEPLQNYRQLAPSTATVGFIPTTSYLEKVINSLLGKDDADKYMDAIKQATIQPYEPNTPFDFTWGQVFGVIGTQFPGEPAHMPKRVMAPYAADSKNKGHQGGPMQFAQVALDEGARRLTVNLGNSLPSTQPASTHNSFVASALLGRLQLCYFKGGISPKNATVIGDINYTENDFYVVESGLQSFELECETLEAVKCSPLGILSMTEGNEPVVMLAEDPQGVYLRADDFVYRMNPGINSTKEMPRGKEQWGAIYAYQFGEPLTDTDISLSLKTQIESTQYSNQTLGTGGSSGVTNLGVPADALKFPDAITTDSQGRAVFELNASDPGSPRGYVDGQVYFLDYGFKGKAYNKNYAQSADDIISTQIYTQVPDFEDVTWDNFVQGVLAQYGKLYPIMNFLQLGDEDSVIKNAEQIDGYLNLGYHKAGVMPVTRDLSESRLRLVSRWLKQHYKAKKCAFAYECDN